VEKIVSGKYSIGTKIGSGGSSDVYLACSINENARVAFKIATKRLSLSHMNWFIQNEVEVLDRMRSPHMIKKIDDGQIDERRYIVLEYLEGEPLLNLVNSGRRISWGRSREILLQLCNALEELHAAGIVHRDIKPGNIFLQNGIDVKLLDFGLAKIPGKAEYANDPVGIGTPSYMAPEMIGGERFDHRSDIYSMGVLMYKIVCGIAPFTGSPLAVMKGHLKEVPVSPRELLPQLRVPMAIDEMIMKSLEKAPERRFQSITEMREELEQCTEWLAESCILDGTRWTAIHRLYDEE
jgi:serine/threonine-protein kinase